MLEQSWNAVLTFRESSTRRSKGYSILTFGRASSAVDGGGRRREILRLRWQDIDLKRGVLYFDQTNTKSGRQREIPIDAKLGEMLEEKISVGR